MQTNTPNPLISIGKFPTHATFSTEVTVPKKSVNSHISAPVVVDTIHNSNATKNNMSINHKSPDQQPQQQHITCVAAHNKLKGVRAPATMGTTKVTRLCARTQQHQEAGGPEGQGERALRTTHTPAEAKVARLCARPPHYVAGPAGSSEECAARAQHTSTHTIRHTLPGALATTLANSPINIAQLNKRLKEYASINRGYSRGVEKWI